MDDRRFDLFTRHLSAGASRRRLLAGLGLAAAGTLVGTSPRGRALGPGPLQPGVHPRGPRGPGRLCRGDGAGEGGVSARGGAHAAHL